MNIMRVFIELLITFIIVYLLYYFFIINKHKKNKEMVPTEVILIMSLYKIDPKQIDLYKMIKLVSLVSCGTIAIVITLMSNFFNNTIILLLFGTLVSVVLAFIFYGMIGRHFEKKCFNLKNNKLKK